MNQVAKLLERNGGASVLDYEWRVMMAAFVADYIVEKYDLIPRKQNPENTHNRPNPRQNGHETIMRLPKKVGKT